MESETVTAILRILTGMSIHRQSNLNRAKTIKIVQINVSKMRINFLFLRISSLISKNRTENTICTMDDVRGDILGPPHGTTPAAVTANKN